MATEIKRSNWSRFCKRFTESNRYRIATVSVRRSGQGEQKIDDHHPFMGIALAKKGRLIDGIELFTAHPDPERLSEPAVSITQPVKVCVEEVPGGGSLLSVHSKDGTVARIELSGEADTARHRSFVEQLAYSYYERRGFAGGNDVGDWLAAESRVRAFEAQLTG
ncbi:MAG: DUF2934 domain-containing protein [Candidatus Zixiibacteriota bacterium]|nr:MAG: DUF2934 domain-containing protein [candidate division Zixibacteria bacterium]